jgi:flavin reductase (DIM6/NTAB) family NADH-FMN oxidoreductase RutF
VKYDPHLEKCPLPYAAFRSCVVPRPIAWLSTKSAEGICNLAPFSQAQIFNIEPPMVCFTANHYPTGARKDTSVNVEKTGWFVWNFATDELQDAVNMSSIIVPSDKDEFELAGLEKKKADLCDVNMVAASPIHLECKLYNIQTFDCPVDDGWKGQKLGLNKVDLIIGAVRRIHIKEEAIDQLGKVDIERIRPLARMGYIDYTAVDRTFSMSMPISEELKAAVSPEVLAQIMSGGI